MTDGDILFLIVFIILPTTIVVSGFWLFLLVRRNRQPMPEREAETASAQPEVDETDIAEGEIEGPSLEEIEATDEQPAAEVEEEPKPALDEQPTVSTPIAAEPAEELDPVTADLLAQEHGPSPDEVEELTPIDDPLSHTEEIPNMPDGPFEPARLGEAEDSEWRPMPTIEPEPEDEAEAEPEVEEPEAEPQPAEDEDESKPPPESRSDREERSTGGRLLPGEHSQPRPTRRGRHAGRHAPRLRRSRRDEGSVEGGDGPGGVDS